MSVAAVGLGALCLVVWTVLVFARGGFWRMGEREEWQPGIAPPERWPSVVAVVPARDEADMLPRSLPSLLAQDYPGPFRIVLVDDGSTDGTAETAHALAAARGGDRLSVLSGGDRPPGWTGKLWAVSRGVAHATATSGPDFVWLVDADIAVAPDLLRRLAARSEALGLALVSLMVRLRCESAAERAFIPAFLYFFQMLYPFARVNDPTSGVAAAAGGVMLVRREALERAGGIESIRHALIDDCALGARLKAVGPIRLLLTDRAWSLRPYASTADIGRMVRRSAYAQLNYSPLLLAGTLLGMGVVYLAPPALALLGEGWVRLSGALALALMTVSFLPVQRFHRLSPVRAVTLPLIGAVYAWWTLESAFLHWRGRGGEWKGRAQAAAHLAEGKAES